MNIQQHVTFALQSSPQIREPFPHFFAENVFPTDFYASLMDKLATKSDFHSEKFANRQFADQISDIPELSFMLSKEFFRDMLYLFEDDLKSKFGGIETRFTRDLRLIRDQKSYKIGPHTDAPWKVLSLLFYLPPTEELKEYGTAMYVPNDPTFTCEGGPHYPFEPFTQVKRAPFVPNSCFGFWKTNKSFHGVPPIPIDIRRDVLLFNIYQATPTITYNDNGT